MGYEVDFLPVGENEKSGDAIIVRYGNLLSGKREDYTLVVIDGGFQENGEKIVEHISQYYKTDKVDIVVSTHPDADHINGLVVVLEKMNVGELWMHQPWKHTKGIKDMFQHGRVTDKSVKEHLRKSLDTACDLEKFANEKKIPIREPFRGVCDAKSQLFVIGPTQAYYEGLIPLFRGTPTPKEGIAGALERLYKAAEEVVKKVFESFDVETLDDSGETSAENNSSTIMWLQVDGKFLLFTGDAGIPAIDQALECLKGASVDFSKLEFVQVSHHGSQRCVGPTILNTIIGPKLKQEVKVKTAFVSASKEGAPKHPSKKVMNAYRRRGAPVHATQGATKRHSHEAPDREGWGASTPLPFYPEVEE